MFRSDVAQQMSSAGLPRRNFLRASLLSTVGLGVNQYLSVTAQGASEAKHCIFLMLNGGPSQLDSWDLKPHAPSEFRGPFKPIRTNVTGIEISEIFPRMAKHADKYALIRSVYHNAEALHETGYQMMQTGRLCKNEIEHPQIGQVLAQLQHPHTGIPSHVVLPTASLAHSSAKLREAFDLSQESDYTQDRYGHNRFGRNCLLARRLVERGVGFVSLNMFERLANAVTWDINGSAPFSPITCYRDVIGPMFDMAYSSLLEDLSQRGLLTTTMVVASGEFGRTPQINPAGGRDHWPHCWTILMAGGGIKGGQVIGASDEIGAYPKERPVTPMEIAATIYQGLGIKLSHQLTDAQGQPICLVEPGAQPIHDLF